MSEYNDNNQRYNNGYTERQPYINRKKIIVTYAVIALNLLIYAVMTIVGRIKDWPQGVQLWVFGAKINPLIEMGQYWRLITCMFLHVGVVHLLCNCYAIFIYGPVVERIYGRIRFILIYFISGIFGSLLSYALSPAASAGASGAIFGLIGCMFYLRQRNREAFSKIFGVNLFIVLGLNLFLGFVQSGIDNYGHIGGFIGGFLTAHLVGLLGEDVSIKKRTFTAIVMLFFCTGCLAIRKILG